MKKSALIIYGPPGAGKGTQANLLAWAKGWIHFDTGKYLEQAVHDPEKQDDPTIKKERRLFDTGILMTPPFVLKAVSQKTKEIADAGFSVVFSGSPRTLFEAFGDFKNDGLIKILEKSYGKKNIFVILLKVRPESSIFRNSNRLVCSVCANGILYSDIAHRHRTCPLCAGKLRKRTLDKPEIIKVRLKEYQERTFPILEKLKKRGYKIINIDGAPLPHRVHQQILKKLPI